MDLLIDQKPNLMKIDSDTIIVSIVLYPCAAIYKI